MPLKREKSSLDEASYWLDELLLMYGNESYRRTPSNTGDKLYDLIVNDGAICADCARENGAVWPKGHCATQWVGECSMCGKNTGCCAVSDWSWPNHKGPRARREF